MTASDDLGAERIMNAHDGQDTDEGYEPGDGWDLFGSDGLGDLAGLIGDGSDAGYMRGVDYTAAIRQAKSGEREVLRALGKVVPPGEHVTTQAWSTPDGEPVVLVEMSAVVWSRWARRAKGNWYWRAGSRRDMITLRDAVRAHRRSRGVVPVPEAGQRAAGGSSHRDFWSRCPAAVMVDLVTAPRG
jgi:hypothetical protein